MFKKLIILMFTASLVACASPPKPPKCDEDNKRPINADRESHVEKKPAYIPETY